MPLQHLLHPSSGFRDGIVHTVAQLHLDHLSLARMRFLIVLRPMTNEPHLCDRVQKWVKRKKSNVSGFPLSTPLTLLGRVAPLALLDLVEEPLDQVVRAIQERAEAVCDCVSAEYWPRRASSMIQSAIRDPQETSFVEVGR